MNRLSPSSPRRCSGPSAKSGLLLAGAIGLALACSSEKEPSDRGLGGSGSGTLVDASVPNLPGDGREPTPASDIDDRQVPYLPSDEYFDNVRDIAEVIGGGGRPSPSDASAGDAGPDGSP